jgi:very-short-patch-repair endonuclease
LVVEIDGASHGEEGPEAHDTRRDAWLRSRGLTVYRVQASSVFEDVAEVADGIRRVAAELMRSGRES